MNERSHTLIKEIIKHAGAWIAREGNRSSLVTITRGELVDGEKRAVLSISVLPESMEKTALDFLQRNADEVRGYLKTHIRSGSMPWIRFGIDGGEKNRQKVNELLSE